jgi:hypothetical protein
MSPHAKMFSSTGIRNRANIIKHFFNGVGLWFRWRITFSHSSTIHRNHLKVATKLLNVAKLIPNLPTFRKSWK